MFQPDKTSLIQPLVMHSAYAARELSAGQPHSSKKPPVCYQTDERYFCQKNCSWKSGCKALTAEWLRRN